MRGDWDRGGWFIHPAHELWLLAHPLPALPPTPGIQNYQTFDVQTHKLQGKHAVEIPHHFTPTPTSSWSLPRLSSRHPPLAFRPPPGLLTLQAALGGREGGRVSEQPVEIGGFCKACGCAVWQPTHHDLLPVATIRLGGNCALCTSSHKTAGVRRWTLGIGR